jgi:hypothetical protein
MATGLVLGWWLRGRRDKKRAKVTAKRHKAEVGKLEKDQEAQRWVTKAQEQKQAETERKLQYMDRQQREAETQRTAERRQQLRQVSVAEAAAAAEQLARKQLEAQRTPEIHLSHVAEQPAEQIEVPDGNRLERSEWLTTQVDVRTGRPVEQPSFHYGREYYRERAAESMPIVHRNAAAGEVALVAAAMDNGRSSGTGSSSDSSATKPQPQPGQGVAQSTAIPSATSSGPPPHVPGASPSNRQDDSSVWLYVAALVVIGILLYVVLR